FSVRGLNFLGFAFKYDMRAILVGQGAFIEDNQVGPRPARAKPKHVFDSYLRLLIIIFANKRLRDFLTDVLFWRFVALSDSVNIVQDLALLDDYGRKLDGRLC